MNYFKTPYSGNPCTAAINEDLIVAGTYLKQVGETWIPRPFVWLHGSQYGLSAGFHDLLDLAPGAASNEPGFANDLSDDGIVVGGRGDVLEAPGLYAFAWDLASYSGGTGFAVPLDTSSNPAIEWSLATAVEKTTASGPIRIVGVSGDVVCGNWEATQFSLSSTTPAVISLPEPPDADLTQVPEQSYRQFFTDVADGRGRILSFDTPAALPLGPDPEDCPPLGAVDLCETDFIAGMYLRDVGGPTWLRIADYAYPWGDPVDVPEERRVTAARAIAGDGLIGGCMQKWVSFTNCRTLPALWDDPTGFSAPEVAPNLPLPEFVSQGLVEAVGEPRSCGERRLAGWEPLTRRGIIWDRCADSGDWCSHLIDALSGNPVATVAQAYDLTNTGYIVVIVDGWSSSCTNQTTVGVMGHRSDLDFDFAVGASDLALLLGGWGATLACDIARYDISADGAVGAADLAMLLGDWSSSVTPAWPCSGLGCETLESLAMSASAEGDQLLWALATVGFAGPTQFADWAQSADSQQVVAAGWMLLEALKAQTLGGEQ